MSAVQYFPRGWFSFAPKAHQYLVEKWFEGHGVTLDARKAEGQWSWDPQTRVLTAGEFQVVTKTPPPWPVR